MENKDKVIQELFARLEQLSRQQKIFQDEIYRLTQDLHKVISSGTNAPSPPEPPVVKTIPLGKAERSAAAQKIQPPVKSGEREQKHPWEEFIGTNLLNKVGIAVLILGIGFGTKYSIDHQLINPSARIALGYLAGVTLIGIALRLREAHTAFSAVLLSGGMAVLYFITYAAHTFYGLIPQVPSFILMVLFTLITVMAAIRYNMEVIGLIGLTGAYAVPLLLSDGSGRIVILFSYITIINSGILFLAFKRYWKRLYYLAFILTWLTFAAWYAFSFDSDNETAVSLIFSTVFFVTFYITFLAYKLIRRESLNKGDIICMLANVFIFYGYGYLTIGSLEQGELYLGLFTVLTALLHFVASVVIYKMQHHFNDIFYFVSGMVLIFLTLAVPVQFEGNWVTLVWAGEAALMFWIGRAKIFPAYEKLSYPLIALAFFSLLHDWADHYPGFNYYAHQLDRDFTIFLNIQFLTSMLVGAALIFILLISVRHTGQSVLRIDSGMYLIFLWGLPIMIAIVLYTGFFKEIEAFWNNQYAASRMTLLDSEGSGYDQYNPSLLNFKGIWLIIYSALFATALCVVRSKWKSYETAFVCLGINVAVLFSFITSGFLDLSELRAGYLNQELSYHYGRGAGHVLIRYVAIVSVIPLLWYNRRLVRQNFFSDDMRRIEDLFFHFVVLVVLSSELVHLLDMARVENSFRLSLSILWGAYALLLVVFGLSRNRKHIRLGAIALFAVTLLKLFVYDMAGMSTILRTVVMIILGTLLLTASFVYNKYKRSAGNETP